MLQITTDVDKSQVSANLFNNSLDINGGDNAQVSLTNCQLSLGGKLDLQNNRIDNVNGLKATGTVQGGTLTDGTATMSNGNVTGVTGLKATGTVQGGTLTDGTATMSSGNITGVTKVRAADIESSRFMFFSDGWNNMTIETDPNDSHNTVFRMGNGGQSGNKLTVNGCFASTGSNIC